MKNQRSRDRHSTFAHGPEREPKGKGAVAQIKSRFLALLGMTAVLTWCPALHAQGVEGLGGQDSASVVITRAPNGELRTANPELYFGQPHPYHVVARHPKAGCAVTEECGEIFMDYWAKNLRTTAGTNWQADVMCKLSAPPAQCNYLALTNTAITPAIADTTLSGEIVINGLERAQATYTNTSAGLATPAAPTVTVRGTTGAVSYWYWVAACNSQGCTVLSTAGTTTTANATLSNTNYDDVSWTAITGATSYKVWRTTSASAPTGTVANKVQNASFCNGTACRAYDISNTLDTDTVAASQQTFAGVLTLVKTWTATATQSAQAFGVFNASSAGTLCFEGTFTQATLNANDTLQLTETIYF